MKTYITKHPCNNVSITFKMMYVCVSLTCQRYITRQLESERLHLQYNVVLELINIVPAFS